MLVALDATYLVDPHPSGIAVYSRELLDGLARSHSADQFEHLYRLKQFRRREQSKFSNVRDRLMLPVLSFIGRPDIFHALNQRVDQRLGKRTVSTFHDLFVMSGEYSSREFRKRFSDQARKAAKRSDMIISVSEFTKSQVVSYLKVEPERIRVVPHGVHLPEVVTPAEQRARFILCVGALQVRKNVVRLVEAFERIPAAVCDGWRLVLAGSTAGFGAAEIVARIDKSRRQHQIQLRGYVADSELKELYQSAAIFAFPSLDEGFGIPVLEAMAHGTAVMTSNRSALPEVAGDAAVLADPYDSDAMANALWRLMEDSQLRIQLGAAGRERARQFPWTRSVEETYTVYEELNG